MKKKLTISIITSALLASSLSAATNEELAAEIEELSELVEQIETKTLSDKIKFAPELRLRMDKFTYKTGDSGKHITPNTATSSGANSEKRGESGAGFDKEWEPHYSLRFRLNMATDMADDVKFTGRMVITHNSQNDGRICVLSRDVSSAGSISDTTFDMDKAYLDWNVTKSAIISAGILPTSGGMSSNTIEDTPRKSVFPSLIFDMTTYGLAASYTPGADIWLRGVAAKAYTRNAGQFFYQCNRETIYNADITAAFAEAKLPMIGNNTAYVGVSQIGNLKALPYLGGSSAAVSMKKAQPMGSMINFGTGLEVKKVAGILDIFAHGSINMGKSNGYGINFTDVSDSSIEKANPDGSYSSYINGEAITDAFTSDNYARGLLNENKGGAIYLGTKAKLPFLKAKLGLEYNMGTKYWFSGTQGAEDVFNKLATRGDAVEAYYIQPLNRAISLRLGYLRIHEKWTGSGWHFGTPAIKDAIQTNIYGMINAYF